MLCNRKSTCLHTTSNACVLHRSTHDDKHSCHQTHASNLCAKCKLAAHGKVWTSLVHLINGCTNFFWRIRDDRRGFDFAHEGRGRHVFLNGGRSAFRGRIDARSIPFIHILLSSSSASPGLSRSPPGGARSAISLWIIGKVANVGDVSLSFVLFREWKQQILGSLLFQYQNLMTNK